MKTYISILRGINVGGHRKLKMEALRKMYEDLGFKEVKSYIQSGNLVFKASESSNLEELIKDKIKNVFEYDFPTIVRTAEEWEELVARNPFSRDPQKTPTAFGVCLFKQLPDSTLVQKLVQQNFQPDEIKIVGKQGYLYIEGKSHLSPLTNNLIEKSLKVDASTRNWKTVLTIKEMINTN